MTGCFYERDASASSVATMMRSAVRARACNKVAAVIMQRTAWATQRPTCDTHMCGMLRAMHGACTAQLCRRTARNRAARPCRRRKRRCQHAHYGDRTRACSAQRAAYTVQRTTHAVARDGAQTEILRVAIASELNSPTAELTAKSYPAAGGDTHTEEIFDCGTHGSHAAQATHAQLIDPNLELTVSDLPDGRFIHHQPASYATLSSTT